MLTTKENINCFVNYSQWCWRKKKRKPLRRSFFPHCMKEKLGCSYLNDQSWGWWGQFDDLKPKNFSRINNQFGSLAQSCSACSGFWGVPRRQTHSVWMMRCVCRNAPRDTAPYAGFSYIFRSDFLKILSVYAQMCHRTGFCFSKIFRDYFLIPSIFLTVKVFFLMCNIGTIILSQYILRNSTCSDSFHWQSP